LTAGSDGNFYGTEADADGYGNVGGVFHRAAAGAFKLLYGFGIQTGQLIVQDSASNNPQTSNLTGTGK
jgi:hypothetical protein